MIHNNVHSVTYFQVMFITWKYNKKSKNTVKKNVENTIFTVSEKK